MDTHGKLLTIFQRLDFENGDISDDTNLRDELGIDSTEFAEIAVAVEKEFAVRVNDDDLMTAKTFGDLVRYIASAPHAE